MMWRAKAVFSKEGEGIVTSQSANVRKREKKVGVGGEEKGGCGPIGWVNLFLFKPTSHQGILIKRPFLRGERASSKEIFFPCNNRKRNRAGTFLSEMDGRCTDAAVISSLTSTKATHDVRSGQIDGCLRSSSSWREALSRLIPKRT